MAWFGHNDQILRATHYKKIINAAFPKVEKTDLKGLLAAISISTVYS